MKKRILCLFMGICIIATVFTGCSSTDNTNNDEKENNSKKENQQKDLPKKLTFTYVTSPLNVPSIVNNEKEIFDDNFEEIGIDVEYVEITSGADQTQALASNDVQVLYGVGASSVILSAANGADIKVLNMYSRSPKAFCLYSKDDKIKSPKDLKGKKIAGPMGTNLHELLVAYLAKDDLKIDDVDYVNMSIPDAKAALDGGSVDVALLAGTTAYQANEQGYNEVTNGEGLIDAIIAVAVTKEFYNKYPTVIDKITKSQEEILEYMDTNEDETLKIVADELDTKEEDVRKMYKYYDFSLDLKEKDKEGFQKTADFMYDSGMIEEKINTNTLFLEKR